MFLGYTQMLDIHRGTFHPKDFYEVVLNADSIKGFNETILAQPKSGKYSFLCEELNDIYHQMDTSVSPEAQLPISSLDFGVISLYGLVILIFQFCLFIAVVCIISIVLTVYSSVSFETRGRQKEVAIRKVYGAKFWDIVFLFCRYYMMALLVSFVIIGVLGGAIVHFLPTIMMIDFSENTFVSYLVSITIILFVTFCTIGQKIFKVAHINPAEMVKKE